MSEVTVAMIENGRAGDPAATMRRRKMNIHVRQAREKLTNGSGEFGAFAPELIRMFAQSHKSATPAMCILVFVIGVTALTWMPLFCTNSVSPISPDYPKWRTAKFESSTNCWATSFASD